MTKVVAVAAPKGGTGKTATAGALIQAGALFKYKVLGVDLDPQSNLTIWMGADPTKPGAFELLQGDVSVADAVQHSDQGADIIAASADLVAISSGKGSAKRLAEALRPVKKKYDMVIIDTGPGLGELMNNALYAADTVLIPVEADTDSLQALYQMKDLVDWVKQSGHRLKEVACIVTRYDKRPKVNQYMMQMIADKAEDLGIHFWGAVRQGVAIREAKDFQVSLYKHNPTSKVATDYLSVQSKLLGKDI